MRLVAGLAVLGLLAASGATAVERAPTVVTQARITATLPPGWHVLNKRLTPCTDPIERLTVVGRSAMVMLQEGLGGGDTGFAPRPDQFTLRGKPQPMECCAPLGRPGWFLVFRDGGRGFYAYVYIGGPGTRAEALAILDSLRVRPRL